MAEVVITEETMIVSITEGEKNETVITVPARPSIALSATGPQGPIGTGIPSGGTTGDLLVRTASGTGWSPLVFPNDAPRSITISEPLAGDSFTLFRTSKTATMAGVTGLVAGENPGVGYEVRYAADRTASGTLATIPTIASNTTIGSAAIIQNMPIPSGNYVWLNITSISGFASEFNLSIAF